MDAVLQVEKLTKVYKRSHLGRTTVSRGVTDISFEVRQGEVFGLLGLNGSGKTTTIKLILGLLFPSSGDVKLFGTPVPNPAVQRRVGYLPEVPYFYRNLTPVEVLRLYGTLSQMDPALIGPRTADVLKLVKMDHAANKPMREFSKGMLQRIGLAQALLHDPEFLVLDEPVTGLDPLGIRQSRELVTQLNKAGKTVLFSSHSISELERLAHRVAIISEGKMVRLLEVAEWRDHPGRLEEIFIETLQKTGAAL
jgi:ABC-2 type transport system ATP-binding protein